MEQLCRSMKISKFIDGEKCPQIKQIEIDVHNALKSDLVAIVTREILCQDNKVTSDQCITERLRVNYSRQKIKPSALTIVL